jgi:hypothetical protein
MNIKPRIVPSIRGGFAGQTSWDTNGAHVWISRRTAVSWTAVMLTVFHEAGHVNHRHHTAHESASNELWASVFVGRMVACTGFDLRAAVADARSRLPDRLHDSEKMASAVVVGFLEGGGKLPADVIAEIWARVRSRVLARR